LPLGVHACTFGDIRDPLCKTAASLKLAVEYIVLVELRDLGIDCRESRCLLGSIGLNNAAGHLLNIMQERGCDSVLPVDDGIEPTLDWCNDYRGEL
jgi:hypothetical protein